MSGLRLGALSNIRTSLPSTRPTSIAASYCCTPLHRPHARRSEGAHARALAGRSAGRASHMRCSLAHVLRLPPLRAGAAAVESLEANTPGVVEGVVTSVHKFGAFVDCGHNGTILLPVSQISGDHVVEAKDVFRAGDRVKAIRINGVNRQQHILSTKLLEPSPGDMLRDPQKVYNRAEETADGLMKQVNNMMRGQIVTGVVLLMNKMGISVRVGRMACWLDMQQISWEAVVNPQDVFKIGDAIRAQVTEVDYAAFQVRLSTRRLEPTPGDMLRDRQMVYDRAEETAAALVKQVNNVKRGQVVSGVVTALVKKGVELRIDLLDARLSMSEIGQDASVDPREVFKIGDTIAARVTNVDPELFKLELSTKSLEPSVVQVGQVVEGLVTSIGPSQASIDCGLGYNATLGNEDVSAAYVNCADFFKEGDRIKAMVVIVDPRKKRCILSTKVLEPSPGDMLFYRQMVFDRAEETAAALQRAGCEDNIKVGQVVEGLVTSIRATSTIINCGRGYNAILRNSSISAERVNCADVFKENDRIKAMVIEVDHLTHRCTLSTKVLEPYPGAMLRDRQMVFKRAEETAAKLMKHVNSAEAKRWERKFRKVGTSVRKTG